MSSHDSLERDSGSHCFVFVECSPTQFTPLHLFSSEPSSAFLLLASFPSSAGQQVMHFFTLFVIREST